MRAVMLHAKQGDCIMVLCNLIPRLCFLRSLSDSPHQLRIINFRVVFIESFNIITTNSITAWRLRANRARCRKIVETSRCQNHPEVTQIGPHDKKVEAPSHNPDQNPCVSVVRLFVHFDEGSPTKMMFARALAWIMCYVLWGSQMDNRVISVPWTSAMDNSFRLKFVFYNLFT